MNSPNVEWSNLIAVGSNLYAIRAIDESPPCCNISYLDCRTHTWLEAPSMRVSHIDRELDGMLYIPGSYDSSSLDCVKVFNTKTQTWNRNGNRNRNHPLASKKRELKQFRKMKGKILKNFNGESGKRSVAYSPKELTWETVGWDEGLDRVRICTIENITYGYSSITGFQWPDTKTDGWRTLKGLEGLLKFAGYSKVTLVGYGAKMVVWWDKYVAARGGYKEKMIWCAEISLEKRMNGEEIWGNVEWVDAVLTVPRSYKFVYAIAATV